MVHLASPSAPKRTGASAIRSLATVRAFLLAAALLATTAAALTGCGSSITAPQPESSPKPEAIAAAPGITIQVLDLALTNRTNYTQQVWLEGQATHRTLGPGATIHLYGQPIRTRAYARYLAYTASATIVGRGVNPTRAVASAHIERVSPGISRIVQ